MRIVYFSYPYFADCDFPLIAELQKQGHEVYYFMHLANYNKKTTIIDIREIKNFNGIVPANEYQELQKFSSFFSFDNFYIVNQKSKRESSLSSVLLSFRLVTRIKSINPDFIISTSLLGKGTWPLYLLRSKTLFVVHDPFSHTGEKSFVKSLFRRINFVLGKKFVLLNEKQLDDFILCYKVRKEQILINKLGTYDALNVFVDDTCVPINNSKNILFFGRISPYKGIEYLCMAMEKVHEVIPDATLTIAGKGNMYFDISQYEQKKYITILNRYISTSELTNLLNNCCISVCPYTDATQSGVIMTSYTLKKPVVATNVGGLSTMVDDKVTGLLCRPCDADDLARAIINILQNDEMRKKMILNIEKKYFNENSDVSWNTIAKKYVDFSVQ